LLNIPTAGMPGHAHLCPPSDCVPWLRTWETLMTAPQRQRHLAKSCKLFSVCNAIQREGNNAPSAMLSNGEEIPSKLPLTMGGSRLPSNTWLLGPTACHTPNAISIEPAVSSGHTVHYPYTSLWDGPFPGEIRTPHLIHGDCGPPHSTCQTASRSVQPFLQDTSSLHHRHHRLTD